MPELSRQLFLDGVFSADVDGKGRIFHPAPLPTQEEVEALVEKVSRRILRFLERRGVITLVTAPGDGEVTVVTDETMAEKDPLLAKLLAAATSGTEVADSANSRREIRVVLDPEERPVCKGTLCGQSHGFNLQNATRVAANDKEGRERLCRYILRPPLANDRLKILNDGHVRLDFKRPWSDGTSSVDLAPLALIARLAALVVPSGPWACPPSPCPTRLRRARRPHLGGTPCSTAESSRPTRHHAKMSLPPRL